MLPLSERRVGDEKRFKVLRTIEIRQAAIQVIERRRLDVRGAFFILYSGLADRLRPGVVELNLVAPGEAVTEGGLEGVVMVVGERRDDPGTLRATTQLSACSAIGTIRCWLISRGNEIAERQA